MPSSVASGATYTLENDQWPVHAADGVVPYPRRDLHHSGIHDIRHGGSGFGGFVGLVSLSWVFKPQQAYACGVVVRAVRSKWEL